MTSVYNQGGFLIEQKTLMTIKLTNKQIRKLQDLHQKRFGVFINTKKAREIGTQLICLMKLTYKSIPKEKSICNQ